MGTEKKDTKPYVRTQESVKNTIKEMNSNRKPKDIFHTIIENKGGLEHLTSSSQKPRDIRQIYNFKRKEKNDEILEVIDMQSTEDITPVNCFLRYFAAQHGIEAAAMHNATMIRDYVRVGHNHARGSVTRELSIFINRSPIVEKMAPAPTG